MQDPKFLIVSRQMSGRVPILIRTERGNFKLKYRELSWFVSIWKSALFGACTSHDSVLFCGKNVPIISYATTRSVRFAPI